MQPTQLAAYELRGHYQPEHGIEIFHPDHGWCPITIVNASEFCIETATHQIWYALDCPVVAGWPISNAAGFVRWIKRVSHA